AGGYPGSYAKGAAIAGLDDDLPDTYVFHAGTTLNDGTCVTNGGRVLCAVGLGETVSAAQAAAYARVDRIHWDGMYCRRDIGYRAVARERGA
ncbi:MAG: phosphoribosylglycinamide synthetase C domain-containing protein, partial [Pseudomonadales bacterium]